MVTTRRAMPDIDVEAVADAIRSADAVHIAPRFGALAAGEIEEKEPGEVVTAADRACEVELTARLRELFDAPVVGEEAAAENPTMAADLAEHAAVWVVDPLDGTSNFAAGSPDYAVMVAFVERGEATASWMWQPATQVMAIAQRGSGAVRNGQRVAMAQPPEVPRCRGVVKDRFLPDDVAATVRSNRPRFGAYDAGRGCAGYEYPDLVAGDIDFLLYWRTLSWDHSPGALFVTEAGGAAVRPDGSPYRAGSDAVGLVAAHADAIDEIRRALLS